MPFNPSCRRLPDVVMWWPLQALQFARIGSPCGGKLYAGVGDPRTANSGAVLGAIRVFTSKRNECTDTLFMTNHTALLCKKLPVGEYAFGPPMLGSIDNGFIDATLLYLALKG